jgi:hypothetical protein
MAQGNLERAKKLYCGQGAQADAYLKKIRTVREEMRGDLSRQTELLAMEESGTRTR